MSEKDKYIPSYPLTRGEYIALRGIRQMTDMPMFKLMIFLDDPMTMNRLESLGLWEPKRIIESEDKTPTFRIQITELGRKVLEENEATIWSVF